MSRTVGDQPSLWEAVLPAEVLRLPEEPARVDALLDDVAVFAPFAPLIDPRMARPSTPMDTCLREDVLEVSVPLATPHPDVHRDLADTAWSRTRE